MFLFSLWVLFFLPSAFAATNKEVSPSLPFKPRPYTPENHEYVIELGSMWEDQNLYWLAGSVGWRLGRCLGIKNNQSCYQFLDVIGGVGGREGLTSGLILASLRWQTIYSLNGWSPFARALAGAMNVRDNSRDQTVGAYGLGVGGTTALHKNFDLRLEARAGFADKLWSQLFLGFSFKLDPPPSK